MIDNYSFNPSLKIKWVQNYLNTDNKGEWKSVFDYYLKKHGGKLLFQGNLKRQDVPLLDLNTKARYIKKSSLGRSRLICQSPLKCAGQIQNGGRFQFKKGKL